MEVKRNPISSGSLNGGNLKSTNLMQPFISISKASTPIRTRVIGGSSQLNSTPINLNKIMSNIHKSPNNKENVAFNHTKI